MFALFFICLLLIGLSLPPGTLSSEMRVLLVTFFGLLSAGLLPALTLLVSTPIPSGISISRIDELARQIERLVKGLLTTLLFILLGGVLVLFSLAGFPKIPLISKLGWLGPIIVDAPERLLQALVFTFLAISLDRFRVVVKAFEIVCSLRRDMALEEAKERLEQRAPSREQIRSMFSKSPDNGKKIAINCKD